MPNDQRLIEDYIPTGEIRPQETYFDSAPVVGAGGGLWRHERENDRTIYQNIRINAIILDADLLETVLNTDNPSLKALLDPACNLVNAEKETPPAEDENRGKTALTELFHQARTAETPILVERIVDDINDIVRKIRFPKWQAAEATEDLGKLVDEASKPKPNKKWYSVSIEGLIQTAENLDKLGESVINLSRKVLSILTGWVID
jgi:hypothetical protein